MRTWDRFLVLSHLVDELPVSQANEVARVVSAACFAVVRSMKGQCTDAEARFAIDRAKAELLAASKQPTTGA